jgi:hypothetical protein
MAETPPVLYCVNHPQTPTGLRCNRCGKPICPKCAISTPTGYRCRECVRSQQKVFETARWYDYLIAFILSASLSFLGGRFIPAFGFFTLFLAPIVGVIIAEAVRFAVGRRRSKRLFQLTALASFLGSLPFLLLQIAFGLSAASRGGLGFIWGLIWQGIYIFMVSSSAYYRLSGIRL